MDNEERQISIEVTPAWHLEYGREIRIQLRHNDHQTSSLHLTRDEAVALIASLSNHLST